VKEIMRNLVFLLAFCAVFRASFGQLLVLDEMIDKCESRHDINVDNVVALIGKIIKNETYTQTSVMEVSIFSDVALWTPSIFALF
jgi:hypothetical protein